MGIFSWGARIHSSGKFNKRHVRLCNQYGTSRKIIYWATCKWLCWELPYVPGITRANSVTTEGAIQIAAEYGVPIQYHEGAQAPYFFYMSLNNIMHIVWFKDARSFNAIAYLVYEYGLQGLSIWNIMNYNSQLWLVININYEIEKVL
jgi:spore germination protein